MIATTIKRNHSRNARETSDSYDDERALGNPTRAESARAELASLSRRKRIHLAATRIQRWIRRRWRLKSWNHTANLLMNYNNQVHTSTFRVLLCRAPFDLSSAYTVGLQLYFPVFSNTRPCVFPLSHLLHRLQLSSRNMSTT
jgi:hypothetical protein